MADALLLDFLELGADLLQRGANRLDQIGDGLLSVLQLTGRPFLELAERCLGQIEERAAVLLQRLGR